MRHTQTLVIPSRHSLNSLFSAFRSSTASADRIRCLYAFASRPLFWRDKTPCTNESPCPRARCDPGKTLHVHVPFMDIINPKNAPTTGLDLMTRAHACAERLGSPLSMPCF